MARLAAYTDLRLPLCSSGRTASVRPAAKCLELLSLKLIGTLAGVVEQAREVRPEANPEQAARELFGVSPRSGWYGYTPRRGVVAVEGQPPGAQWNPVDVALTQEYLRYCEAKGQPGDCRRVLLNNPVLTGEARYALTMSFAMENVAE